jgi:hypothetical protein
VSKYWIPSNCSRIGIRSTAAMGVSEQVVGVHHSFRATPFPNQDSSRPPAFWHSVLHSNALITSVLACSMESLDKLGLLQGLPAYYRGRSH